MPCSDGKALSWQGANGMLSATTCGQKVFLRGRLNAPYLEGENCGNTTAPRIDCSKCKKRGTAGTRVYTAVWLDQIGGTTAYLEVRREMGARAGGARARGGAATAWQGGAGARVLTAGRWRGSQGNDSNLGCARVKADAPVPARQVPQRCGVKKAED